MNINQFFETLASNNSRLFKEAELEKVKDNEVLKKVIFLALDPFTQFYIRKIPSYIAAKSNQADSLDSVLDSLHVLSSRQATGNAGIEFLTKLLSSLIEDDAKVIERIIGKDLKCGASVSTVNKIWPGLIAEYPCMLASGYEQKLIDKVTWPAYAQLKLDGMRFNAIVKDGVVDLRSRNGKEIMVKDPLFLEPFKHMASFFKEDMVFDGEMLVVNESGKIQDRQTGNGILNKAVKGTISEEESSRVRATLWDAIPFDKFISGKYDEPYKIRLAKLSNCISDLKSIHAQVGHLVDLVYTKKVDSLYEAQSIFEKFLADGQEGIILKTEDMIWEDKRSKHQIKFKGELECDLKIVDIQAGTGKYKGMLGAIICESSDGVVQVSVGSGFNDEHRQNFDSSIIGKIAAVKYNARITNKQGENSLFLPVFVEIRDDKNKADHSKDIK